ncbi:MAG: PAS domain S-box protein [Armatimonadota bacterium]
MDPLEIKRKFTSLPDLIKTSLALISLDGNIEYINKSAENFMKTTIKDAFGKPFCSMYPWNINPKYTKDIKLTCKLAERSAKPQKILIDMSKDCNFSVFVDIIPGSLRLKAVKNFIIEWRVVYPDEIEIFKDINSSITNSYDIVIMRDLEGNIAYCNVPTRFNLTQNEIAGKKFSEIFNKEFAEKDKTYFDAVISSGQNITNEGKLKYGPIDYWFLQHYFPVKNSQGKITGVGYLANNITEKKIIEQAWKSAEKEYESIFENTPICVFRVRYDGKILKINPAGARMFGYEDPNEMMNLVSDVRIDIFDNRDEIIKKITESSKKNELLKIETHARKKDGSIIYINANARPIYNEDNKLLYFEGFVIDDTQRYKMYASIKEQEQILSTIFDLMPGYTYFKDKDFRIVYMNKKTLDNFNFKKEDVVGKTDFDLFPKDIAEKHIEQDQITIETGQEVNTEIVILDDTTFKTILDKKTAVKDEDGNLLGIIGIGIDITELKRTQNALKKTEAMYRSIFDNSPIGIIVINDDNDILELNPQMAKILGFDSIESAMKQKLKADQFFPSKDELEKIKNIIYNTQGTAILGAVVKRIDGSDVLCKAKVVKVEDPNTGELLLHGFVYELD